MRFHRCRHCSYGWTCVIQRGRGLILFIISQLKLLKLNPCLKLQSKYRIKLISPGNLGLWEHYRSPWFELHVPPAHGDMWRMLFCANCPTTTTTTYPYPSFLALTRLTAVPTWFPSDWDLHYLRLCPKPTLVTLINPLAGCCSEIRPHKRGSETNVGTTVAFMHLWMDSA